MDYTRTLVSILPEFNAVKDELSVSQKKLIEQQENVDRALKAMAEIGKDLRGKNSPESLICFDALVVMMEKDLLARTPKDKAKCEDILNEKMDILKALSEVRDKDKYVQHVMMSGLGSQDAPRKNAFFALADKHIQQMGKLQNTIDASEGTRELLQVRKENLTAVKAAYIDLQKEALLTQKTDKNKEAELKKENLEKDGAEQDSNKLLYESQQVEREQKVLQSIVDKHSNQFEIYVTSQTAKMDRVESKLNNAIIKQDKKIQQHQEKKPSRFSLPTTKKQWAKQQVALEKGRKALVDKKAQIRDSKDRSSLRRAFARANPKEAEAIRKASERLDEIKFDKYQEQTKQVKLEKEQGQKQGRTQGIVR